VKSLAELAAACGGELVRADGALQLNGVAPLEKARPDQIAFYTNAAYRKHLAGCRAGAIIVSAADAELPELVQRPLLIAVTPYAAFARISQLFHPVPRKPAGIHPSAVIHPEAVVDPTARVEAMAHVGQGSRIGANAVLMAGAYVGDAVMIGDETIVHPRVVVRDGCLVGARCILQPGAVIGADGFGFAFDPEGDGEGPIHRKIPQAGIVRIEDDVEIGANACVDRATLGETVIGRGTKIDNLVQIAHNVQIGPLCVLAAQTGIAGSTTVGFGVAMGGQSGAVGHLSIGDMVRVGAQSGVTRDVEPGTTVGGFPAMEQKTWLRSAAAMTRVPELLREIRALARRLSALEKRTGAADSASTSS
jgi:UDP-3-O-[3-hydroxymyristoyl] glucosamine N-acyltransferase